MKIKQLIKKSISQKTLFADVFGYSLTKTGFADKYLAGQLTMYKSYSWLKKHFENDLKQIKTELPKEQNCGGETSLDLLAAGNGERTSNCSGLLCICLLLDERLEDNGYYCGQYERICAIP